MKAHNDPNKPWYALREPFAKIEEWETENGTALEVGETVLAKPKYIDKRLKAEVESLYWDPRGLPGGRYDHRGEPVSRADPADMDDTASDPVKYKHPDRYECVLHVLFVFHPEDPDFEHMEGRQYKTEAYNIDFVVGSEPEIRRDRANCNAENTSR